MRANAFGPSSWRLRMHAINRLFHCEEGQDLTEYGLLMGLIAIVAVGAVTNVGNIITTVFWDVIARVMTAISA
jgi:pilus assembly protein Flp/PilA